MITRYTTKSGSIYDVRSVGEQMEVRRFKLGEQHVGNSRLRRLGDELGCGEWTPVIAVTVTNRLYIQTHLETGKHYGNTLITNLIEKREELRDDGTVIND